ncbi:MAG TPA: hypothetical protein VII29_13055, partial [Terriglobales bacterium]
CRRSCAGGQQSVEGVPKALQCFKPLGRSVDHLGFSLKELLTVALDQYTEDFAHAPTRRADYLQSGWSRAQQRNAAVAQDSYTVRVTIEGLQLKSFQIKTL